MNIWYFLYHVHDDTNQLYAHKPSCMYLYVSPYICMYVYVCVCMCMYVYVCVCMNIKYVNKCNNTYTSSNTIKMKYTSKYIRLKLSLNHVYIFKKMHTIVSNMQLDAGSLMPGLFFFQHVQSKYSWIAMAFANNLLDS